MTKTINFQAITTNLISTDTGKPTGFVVNNQSGKALKLYWIDREGNEKLYHDFPHGSSINQSTMTSHAWLLKSDDGSVGMKFLPSAAGQIIIHKDNTPSFIDYTEKVISTSQGLWSTATGFGLIDAAASLGVKDVADLPMGGENNNGALNAMNASAAWAAGYTGKGVKVAVVDAGIANSRELEGKIVAGYDFYDRDNTPTPDEGPYKDHALGVASIIAASHAHQSGRDTMGVAPDASIINVRVGSSTYGSGSNDIAAGIRYAVDQGAKVICMPLQSSATGVDMQVAEAVNYAYKMNVVTIIIAGNYSNYGPTGPALTSHYFQDSALVVGNYNIATDVLFESSNMAGDSVVPWVVASSSGWVPNSSNGYSYFEDGGTSFAGPYVAGLAALLWQQNPNATAAQIMLKITKGASVDNNELPMQGGMMGNNTSQTFHAEPNMLIDAGGGIDTVVFKGNKDDYNIKATAQGFTISNLLDKSANKLVNVERLTFKDAAIALDVDGNGGDAYRLYQAAFDRVPDLGGLGFWIDKLDSGLSLETVAGGFIASPEFASLYGANQTDEQLIDALYHNVLNRSAEAEGKAFWMNVMANGLSDEQLLIAFSNSTENQDNVATIIGQGFEYTPYG